MIEDLSGKNLLAIKKSSIMGSYWQSLYSLLLTHCQLLTLFHTVAGSEYEILALGQPTHLE